MNCTRFLTRLDAEYPSRLRDSPYAPACLATRGGSLEAKVVVALVGSRRADKRAARFTERLAARLTGAGAVVVSGGALGIDAAAHRGALAAGGRTWVVAATGHEQCFPPAHAPLFEQVGQGPGAMLWPFGPKPKKAFRSAFPARNRVLVTLADAVVVIQAGPASGALNAAYWAKRIGRPLWVAPCAPWMRGFGGSRQLLREGAHPLASRRALLKALGLAASEVAPASLPPVVTGGARLLLSPSESAALRSLALTPLHLDVVSTKSHLSTQETAAALLTLALENVVVEGPPGFFRRRDNR
ncbi:MAG: DNA-protecting protein DprA [Polyangiaceae bacterium]|nr:DNA-protecting protein DprA [Polyangiaceae bacterium]